MALTPVPCCRPSSCLLEVCVVVILVLVSFLTGWALAQSTNCREVVHVVKIKEAEK